MVSPIHVRKFRGADMRRTAMASLAASACLFSVTACSTSEPTEASPPAESSPPTSASPSPSTSPTETAYLQAYSEEERTAYREAVDDYAAFSRRLAAINEAGRATPRAKAFFKQKTAAWQSYWARLRANERRGIQIAGMGRTLRTRPADVRVDPDGGGEVALRVCGISEGVKVLQDGEPVSQPSPKPTIVRVQMVKLPDESAWRVLSERVGAKC
jgi:hypothetical protein